MASKPLLIKDVVMSLLARYTTEKLPREFDLRGFAMEIFELIVKDGDIIEIDVDQFETFLLLLDAYGYDNIAYWNFLKLKEEN